jgi:predicted KAP-like P-loop ATPase
VELEKKERERLSKVMGVVPSIDFETYWKNEVEALRAAYKEVITTHPDAKMALEKMTEVLTNIASLAGCAPGRNKEWTKIVEKAEASRMSLCDHSCLHNLQYI